ncbi:aldose 1-epimerase [Deinococcus fonticola]|uniref:aldose 1-epimerase n=1 Tax=Deinococcus fonticola TaxID=2528713 RepID=UPI00107571C0|nr:aldose 1-epimerase [Deinococcus fonticola]
MNVQTLRNEFFTLEVLPEVGASILNLRAASGRPIMREVKLEDVKTSSQCACFTLAPYSNRIRDAKFTFGGQEVALKPTTSDGLAQHGDVRNRPWQVSPAGPSRLACTFDSRAFPDTTGTDMNWPWAFTVRVEYILHGPHFDTSITLTNVDSREMPAGVGFHPYFTRLHEGVDPLLSFDAALAYDTDERVLATGEARPVAPAEDYRTPSRIGERQVDQAYTAWDQIAVLDWGERCLTITADNIFSHLIVYTAPDGSLALEPVSHATDAFNLAARGVAGVDMRTLASGQSLAGTMRLSLGGAWSGEPKSSSQRG